MNIRTFWITVLKLFGIYLVYTGLLVIPTILSATYYIGVLADIAFLLFWIILCILILYLFLFKTSLIIDKLKLDKGYSEEKMELKDSKKSILSIAIIVIGGLIFVDAIPFVFRELIYFLQTRQMMVEYEGTSWLLFYLAKIIIGCLMVTKSHSIVKFILKKQWQST